MKTPYDTAVRVRQREVDDVRVAISVEVGRLAEMDRARQAISGAVARETELAGAEPMMSTYAYLTRMRARRVALDENRVEVGARLDRLRDQASAAYGSLRATETAADAFRVEQGRAAAVSEQARVDDFATAAFLARRKRNAGGRAA